MAKSGPMVNETAPSETVSVPSLSALTVGLSQEEQEIVHHLRSLIGHLPTGWGDITCTIQVRDNRIAHFRANLMMDVAVGKVRRESADMALKGARR